MSRTIVVIGASSGIGLATARAFAEAGDTVHAAARREIDEPGVTAHRLDFTDRDAVAAFAAGFERVDALIIAAGTNIKERRLHELTPESWDHVIDANLNGPFYALRAFHDALHAAAAPWSSSRASPAPTPTAPAPPTRRPRRARSRSPTAPASRSAARSAARSILPGVVDTAILDNRPEPPDAETRAQMLHAEDVAAACVFAVSLPPRAYVPELTILPTALQAIGKTIVSQRSTT